MKVFSNTTPFIALASIQRIDLLSKKSLASVPLAA